VAEIEEDAQEKQIAILNILVQAMYIVVQMDGASFGKSLFLKRASVRFFYILHPTVCLLFRY
jgi:hypothetical protein